MPRKIEFGAGIATVVLALIGLAALLLAPFPYCTVANTNGCPARDVRTMRLIEVKLDSGVWIYVIGMAVFLLIGGVGAIAEARYRWRPGMLLLWMGAVLAFIGCSLGAGGGPGLMYLPGMLALALAGYASVYRQLRGPRRHRSHGGDGWNVWETREQNPEDETNPPLSS